MQSVIGIIVAMMVEFNLVKDLLSDVEVQQYQNYTFCTGKLGTQRIVLMKSGIGKVNAALATRALIDYAHPNYILNTGVAGGIDRSLAVADIVVGSSSCYHDFYLGEVVNESVGFPEQFQADAVLLQAVRKVSKESTFVKYGLICTGDQFITNNEALQQIKQKLPDGLAVDMESAAIAHACYLAQVPFLSIRIISDTPWVDHHSDQYEHFWEDAPQKNFALLQGLLKALP